MVILEGLLIASVLTTCTLASFTDIKSSIIPNKLLLIAGACIAVQDCMYYTMFAREYVKVFLVDFVLLCITSILMYALSLWSAGDSKLLIVVIMGIPGRLYSTSLADGIAPAVYVIVLTFAIAFVYIAGESVVLAVKDRIRPDFQRLRIGFISFLKQYYCCMVYIASINYLLLLFASRFLAVNMQVLTLFSLFLAILLFKYDFFFKKIPLIIASIAAFIIIGYYYATHNGVRPDYKVFLYLFLVILVRLLAERFNYKAIKTTDVLPGMVMSMQQIAIFSLSRVKGLPETTTEDVRSRITPEMVESIKRWEHSAHGQPEIIIIRKIPFAVFILLGTVVFLVLRIGVI